MVMVMVKVKATDDVHIQLLVEQSIYQSKVRSEPRHHLWTWYLDQTSCGPSALAMMGQMPSPKKTSSSLSPLLSLQQYIPVVPNQ